MRLEVLGSSGGIGAGLRTTALLVDDDILIDAGTGVGDLSLERMDRLRHIFITHAHMDHITSLPLLFDSIFDRIKTPITVHAQQATLDVLRNDIFNWRVWPDFSQLPEVEWPVLKFREMHPGEIMSIGDRTLEMISVNHTVPAVAYRVESGTGVFAFSGDTTTNDSLWHALDAHPRLDLLIVEAAFENRSHALAEQAKHYTPQLLADDLHKLKHRPPLYVSHLKPGAEDAIMEECRQCIGGFELKPLSNGHVFTL